MSGHEGERRLTGATASHLAPCCEAWLVEQVLVEMRGRRARPSPRARAARGAAPGEHPSDGLGEHARRTA
jgi:hypothetical protein